MDCNNTPHAPALDDHFGYVDAGGNFFQPDLPADRAAGMTPVYLRPTNISVALRAALELAVRQNEHDMLLTGDELRWCREALANVSVALRLPDERIEEIAEQVEATDPTDSFWKTFARAVLAAALVELEAA